MVKSLFMIFLAAALSACVAFSTHKESNVKQSLVKLGEGQAFVGTGFIVNSAGCIVTASHVVRREQQLVVEFADLKERIVYQLVADDPANDVAVMCPTSLVHRPHLSFHRPHEAFIGEKFKVTGFSYVTWGFLHVPVLVTDVTDNSVAGRVYTDSLILVWDKRNAPLGIKLGFSGSPVIDSHGAVHGLLAYCYGSPAEFLYCGTVAVDHILSLLDRHGVIYEVSSET